MIRRLKPKDKVSFIDYCRNDIDNVSQKFWDLIKRCGLCYVWDDGQIDGILFIEKKDDKKFLRIIVKDNKKVYYFLSNLLSNHNIEMFWELENDSKLIKLAHKFKFYPSEKKEKSTIYRRRPWRKDLNKNGSNNNSKYHNKYQGNN